MPGINLCQVYLYINMSHYESPHIAVLQFLASLSFPKFTHNVSLSLLLWKVLFVLLDLLFQFITRPPFTMTHASCQSLWPVWEPATAAQSFTYWTMVRGGIVSQIHLIDICLWLLHCMQKWSGQWQVGWFRMGVWFCVVPCILSGLWALWAVTPAKYLLYMYFFK